MTVLDRDQAPKTRPMQRNRSALVASLDDALLGLRPRPAGYFAALAS